MNKYSGFYCRCIKRVFDIVVSGLVLIAFWWLYAIIALMVKIFLGSPVIFSQERPGKISPKTGKAKIFKLYKFRSMTNETDENGKFLSDTVRLTKFGKILRATSLDEIPEMWNILKGDMSIVGPRPWLVRYLNYYTEYEMQRQYVRPGLTGLAQVNGRNAAGWEERFRYDVDYIHNVSLGLDIKIIFKTVKNVFTHKNIEFDKGHQTLREYFKEKTASSDEVSVQ